MRALVVVRHPSGPRVWILSYRIHHGASGLVACALLLMRRRHRLALLALLAVLHDRRDWRDWFGCERLGTPPPRAGA